MAVRLKTDENLPHSAAARLRDAGHDVTTALEQELGGARDPRLAAVCKKEERALVTLDRGLGDVRSYPPGDYYGIIVLRPRDQDIDTILRFIVRLVGLLEEQSVAGALWIITENRVRIRR